MKHTTRTLIGASLALSVALSLLGCQSSGSGSQAASEPVSSAQPETGVQKATITVDNGFSPSSLSVKAGQPVELTFDTKHHGCASSVVFKDLNIEKPLTDGKKTVVTFTPSKPGTIGFACNMNMIKGSVNVQ